MLSRFETRWRHVRRFFSRSHWLTRLLGLPVRKGKASRPGLVMIQVDGLSRSQLEHALASGEMPFLKKLIKHEHYRIQTQYSGLPSSTPAVQAEIFYGVKTAVPAFSYLDRESGEMVRMYVPSAASRIEQQCSDESRVGLMSGGSSYSNSFTGGADVKEAHFCASSMGWGEALRAVNPFALMLLIITNINSVIRIIVLLVIELVISIVDFFRGLVSGRNFFKELKFIPTRVAICILLRELCVIGGKIDISRGLPIVHINFLGYDEQSHRRGPSSKFAHWTLKGIDDAIHRLYAEAQLARWRNYEVWIYSDHGQCVSTSYFKLQGYSIEEAVAAVVGKLESGGIPVHASGGGGVETHRVRMLGGQKSQRLFPVVGSATVNDAELEIQVVGLGPVGFVYFPQAVAPGILTHIAVELATTHHVPAVVTGREGDQLRAWAADGEYLLPQQTAELFGHDHPFLSEIGEDLERLCRHPGAGELTLLGWRKGSKNITFATENGSHAGLTHEETRAFNLLPIDAPIKSARKGYCRPVDLRNAALRHLGRLSEPNESRYKRGSDPVKETLRILTYNVHGCVGLDGKLVTERIARVIAQLNPDVVALQELDVGRARSEGEDQAADIARYLEMNFHFHPALNIEEEKYGEAILTHLPMRKIKAAALPGNGTEPRGALWVEVEWHGARLNILNTHLGLSAKERQLQMEALVGEGWLGHPECHGPVVLCGDFNA
ncbi:MAG: endonuclease/exonuclease/phosphatase family protein, partial [Gammaproteobacteria bacterium]|nr:endonuclease/exonuclease/phosphatase family protein [Gammaproteobacteria bacterium]